MNHDLNSVADRLARRAFARLDELASRADHYAATARALAASGSAGDPWEQAYALIFSAHLSRQVFDTLSELGMRLDYCDPDTSYEEDATAFCEALRSQVESLRPFLGLPATTA